MNAKQPDPQKRLWSRMMRAWDEGLLVCRHHLARRYTAENPADPYGWMVLAQALSDFGRHDEGRRALAKAEELAPADKRAEVWIQLGHHYRDRGDYAQAETHYRRVLEEEESTTGLIFLGACLTHQNRLEEAKSYYERAASRSDGHPDEALLNLGYLVRAEERYDEALELFDKALRIDPDYEEALEARRDILRWRKLVKEEEKG